MLQNVELRNVVLVDNSCYSFMYQVENGIPIIPFYNDPDDEELKHLVCYIENLAFVEDVRVANRQAFDLMRIIEEDEH